MDSLEKAICKPALIYLVISLIMLCVGVLLKLDTSNLATTFSQLSGIIVCTLLLMGLCSIAPEISWVLTTIFIICTVFGVIAMLMNWLAPPMM